MEEPKFTFVEDRRGWIDHVRRWLPRLAIAILFFFLGKSKFNAQSGWIKIFDQIGFGHWLRYLTGTLQMVGAFAVLIPRIFPLGILMLSFTMLGAMAAWVFVLKNPLNAIFPGALLVGLLLVGGEELVNLFSRDKKTGLS